MCCIF